LQPAVTWRGLGPAIALSLAATAGACAPVDDELDIGSLDRAAKVSDFFTSTCSTSVVLGLSLQVADEVMCLEPDAFGRFEEGRGILFSSSAVLP